MVAFVRAPRHRAGDAGLSLLEVVVAMAIFAIGVTAILGIFVNTGDVVGDDIRRTAAANLVNKTLEAARAQTAVAITNGEVVSTQAVGDITYTITQNAGFLTSNATASVCQSQGSTLAYKRVQVSVTWPNMGTTQPVTGNVLRAIGIGAPDGLDSSTAALAVLVTGATGLPVRGVTVALSGTSNSQVTGQDGCAVFAGLTVGGYTATASQSGYVGSSNTLTASSAISAAAGTVTRVPLLYDTERTLNYVFGTPAAGVVPTGLPIRIGDTYVPETTVGICTGSDAQACLTGVPGAINHLFPESYTVKAGSCTETDPSQGSIDIRKASANNSTVTIPMGAVTVRIQNYLGAGLSGRKVTMTYSGTGTCAASPEAYTTSSVAGGSTVLLPYGTWTFSTVSGSGLPLATSAQVSVNSSSRTATVTLTALS